MKEYAWSEWCDFNPPAVAAAPETPGVFMMHASMKILYIGGAGSIREGLTESMGMPCARDATRFKYMEEAEYGKIRDEIVADYRKRHDGDLPRCMQE